MKKTALILTLTLLTAGALPAGAFAADAPEAQTSAAPITLTLEQAYDALKDSPQMQMIDIQYTADRAVASGYAEGASSIADAKANLDTLYDLIQITPDSSPAKSELQSAYNSALSTLSGTNENLIKANRDFAKEILEQNKTARLNELNLSLMRTYYGVKNVETLTAIAKENLDITQKTYDQTALKYNLGTASKMELLNAESDLNTAKNGYTEAANGLAQAKMGFNMYMGYDLHQEVILASEVAEIEMPEITLEEAIKEALANRLSIKNAEQSLKTTKMNAGNYTAYPSSSSTYLAGKASVLGAQTAYDMAAPTVEMDVRTKYMAMTLAKQKVESGKLTVANAKEVHRLAELQYQNGLCTLTQVQAAQLGYIAAQNTQASALLEYNLAVQEFIYSYGCGTEAITLAGGR